MTDNQVRAYIGDKDSYLDINPLNVIGTWATDVEMFAAALMLNTNIYIFILITINLGNYLVNMVTTKIELGK